MAIDAKKHSTIAAGEKPTRAALAAAILSINDVIPVANATEATQVVAALAALGQPIASSPVVVARADARGLHRLEITYDPAGLVWAPLSGVLAFASKSAADTFGSANGALLNVNDECRVGATRYIWSGTAWVPMFAAIKVRMNTPQSIANATFTTLLWDTEVFDVGDFRVAGAPGDLVAPVKGIYQVNATGGFPTVFTGRVLLQFLKNGAVEYGGNLVPTAGSDDVSAHASTIVQMNAGDVLRVQIFQSSGSAQNTSTSAYAQPTATLHLIATN